MNRRSVLTSSAIIVLGLAALSNAAEAQQKTLKEQLAGAWILVSFENTATNAEKTYPLGAKPNGMVIYDASGYYSVIFTNPDRPKWKSPNRNEASPEEIKSAFFGTIANSGTWSVDADGKTVLHRVTSALNPNVMGRENRIIITIVGDELQATEKGPNGGTNLFVEKRAK